MALFKPTPCFLDSPRTQNLAANPVFHKRFKYIAITFHRVREHVNPDREYGTAILIHVRNKDQTADIFTKSLTGQDFMVHRERSLEELWKNLMAVTADNRTRKSR